MDLEVYFNAICTDEVDVVASGGTRIFKFDLQSGAYQELPWSEPIDELYNPMLREDGIEFAADRRAIRHTTALEWRLEPAGLWTDSFRRLYGTSSDAPTTCRSQFRSLLNNSLILDAAPCRVGVLGFSAVRARDH
jgi:hypothetical protein